MSAEKRLKELGLELPKAASAIGLYVPATRHKRLIFTSGQLPMKDGKLMAAGKVGSDVTVEQARSAAAQAAMNALAAAAGLAGSINNITAVVRLNVFVNSAPGFTDQAAVANGASDLLIKIFGEAGRHTRCTIGVAELPLNAALELDMILEAAQGMADIGLRGAD